MNYRFGLKKLPEIGQMKVGLKSKFGLKPISGYEEVMVRVSSGCGECDITNPIVWTDLVNCEASPMFNDLTKNGGGNGWNAGAISDSQIDSAVVCAGIEFILACVGSGTSAAAGLSHDNPDQNYDTIDFCVVRFKTGEDAHVSIYENGVEKWSTGAGITGDPEDKFRIVIGVYGEIKYCRNSVIEHDPETLEPIYGDWELLYTSATSPTFPLFMDTSMYTENIYVAIKSAKINIGRTGDE